MRRFVNLCGLTFAATSPFTALADTPEQIEQIEPEGGAWQVEYSGQIGEMDADGSHTLELLYGVTDVLALGIEIEAEADGSDLSFDEFGLQALVTLVPTDDAPVGFGLLFEAGFDADARFAEAEARLILEHKTGRWWAQGNLIARHSNESGKNNSQLAAYAWSLQRGVMDDLWLGMEGSGQAFQLGGFDDPSGEGFESGHFLGPSLSGETNLSDETEIEAGIAWLRRLKGDGALDTVRVFVQIEF